MASNIPEKIRTFNQGRIPSLLKLKYKDMRDDKYRFLRAIPHLFYEDTLAHPFLYSSPNVWLCGDLHLENLGSYKGDNRIAYFDINDFDECLLGPCLLDISRMLTSIYVASANLSITKEEAHNLCKVFTDTYFHKLEEGYIRDLEMMTTSGAVKQFLVKVQDRKRKAFIKKKTKTKKGKTRIIIDKMHTLPLPDAEKELVAKCLRKWAMGTSNPKFYNVKDITFRIAGTSSLGIKRYIVLVEGRGSLGGYFLIDIKEALPSCIEKFIKVPQPKWKSEAERVVEVQKRILSVPPALLATIDMEKKHFVLKELQPTADRIDYTMFHGNFKKLKNVLQNMASITAWSNLRSSGRQGSAIADELIYFAKSKQSLKKQVIDFAFNYSKIIDGYYKEYCNAYDKGFFKIKG